ncbi:GntR family transcriptional regulator [Aquabacter sp. CN5-332]|uniref:GntR family transcriptional regulator n=1 Tax=Aquabacter sp. CN5-332 TaxID=3156608 RepID=UPI0032B5D4FB
MALPLYQRIAADLAQKIASGELAVGAVIPSELELAQSYKASRNTVRSALRQLQDLHLISRRRNRGTRVEAPPQESLVTRTLSTRNDLMALAEAAQREIRATSLVVLDTEMARLLKCPPGSRWLRISLVRWEPGVAKPLAWTRAFVDPHYKDIVPLAKQQPGTLFCDLIESHYGRPIATVEQTVSGCLIEEDAAEILGVPVGSAGLRVLRHYRDMAAAMVEATVSFYPADRFSIRTTLSRRS